MPNYSIVIYVQLINQKEFFFHGMRNNRTDEQIKDDLQSRWGDNLQSFYIIKG